MTARVRRPLVASISLVLPLALSISRFTGRESSATMATICWATTTLPWPTFIRFTATPLALLKVLHLLAHLLEHALPGQRGLAQLEAVGLGEDARLVDGRAAEQRANALAQPLLTPLGADGRARGHGLHDGAELDVQAPQLDHEPLALRGAPLD